MSTQVSPTHHSTSTKGGGVGTIKVEDNWDDSPETNNFEKRPPWTLKIELGTKQWTLHKAKNAHSSIIILFLPYFIHLFFIYSLFYSLFICLVNFRVVMSGVFMNLPELKNREIVLLSLLTNQPTLL